MILSFILTKESSSLSFKHKASFPFLKNKQQSLKHEVGNTLNYILLLVPPVITL